MSFSIDTNILIYASDTSNPWHEEARSFLETCCSDTELWYLTWPAVMSYLRISTHPSIFKSPLTPAEASGNIESMLKLKHVRVLGENESFWDCYAQLSQGLKARSNLIPDVHIAAILKSHGVHTMYTNDRDFLKFDFLTVKMPFAQH